MNPQKGSSVQTRHSAYMCLSRHQQQGVDGLYCMFNSMGRQQQWTSRVKSIHTNGVHSIRNSPTSSLNKLTYCVCVFTYKTCKRTINKLNNLPTHQFLDDSSHRIPNFAKLVCGINLLDCCCPLPCCCTGVHGLRNHLVG